MQLTIAGKGVRFNFALKIQEEGGDHGHPAKVIRLEMNETAMAILFMGSDGRPASTCFEKFGCAWEDSRQVFSLLAVINELSTDQWLVHKLVATQPESNIELSREDGEFFDVAMLMDKLRATVK